MGNLWLKIRIWTKMIVFGLIALYVLLFVLNNSGHSIDLWAWFNRKYSVSVLLLLFITFLTGVLGTLLVRTILTTVRQVREAAARNRSARLERDLADMKAKAARLHTRPVPPAATDADA
jgi:lysylphosphatidylglycerol synthetase-like protein (DUF2156 family)